MPPRRSHKARTMQARGELQRWPPLAGPGALGCAARQPAAAAAAAAAPAPRDTHLSGSWDRGGRARWLVCCGLGNLLGRGGRRRPAGSRVPTVWRGLAGIC